MSTQNLNIENNLLSLEKNIGSSSSYHKALAYSVVLAIISIYAFRPIYIYTKQTKGNKTKKLYTEEYILSYYRTGFCFVAYLALYFLLFKYYLKM